MNMDEFNFEAFNLENIDSMNLTDIAQFRHNKHEFIKFMQRLNLLSKSKVHSCGDTMKMIKRGKCRDEYCFYCNKCKSELSLRNGSFFENSKLDLYQIFVIIYCVV